MTYRPIPRRVFREEKALLCVCCVDDGSCCSAWPGKITSAVRSASEPDYHKRKNSLLVCERSGRPCSGENAGRQLLLQTYAGDSQFWSACRPSSRRGIFFLLAGSR